MTSSMAWLDGILSYLISQDRTGHIPLVDLITLDDVGAIRLDVAGDQLLQHAFAGWFVDLVERQSSVRCQSPNMSTESETSDTRMVPDQ